MIKWMRKIAPYGKSGRILLAIPIAVFLLLEVIKWMALVTKSIDDREIMFYQTLLLGLFALLYGGYRAYFHPAGNREYYTWLSKTPWRLGKTLPLGPVHLVPQDLVVLAVLEGLWVYVPVAVFPLPLAFLLPIPLLLFLLSYSLNLSSFIVFAGGNGCTLYFLFGLGWIVYMLPNLLAGLGVAIVTYALMQVALRRNLAQFPWHNDLDWDRISGFVDAGANRRATPLVGWPFNALMYRANEVRNPLLVSVVVGWWAFQLEGLVRLFTSGYDLTLASDFGFFWTVMRFTYGGLAVIFVGWRLFRYLPGHRSPISIFGRIATGRIIIPGFDKVFVVPICALLTMCFLPSCLEMLGVSFFGAQSIALGFAVFMTLKIGPTCEEWDLTGDYRMAPPMVFDKTAYKRI